MYVCMYVYVRVCMYKWLYVVPTLQSLLQPRLLPKHATYRAHSVKSCNQSPSWAATYTNRLAEEHIYWNRNQRWATSNFPVDFPKIISLTISTILLITNRNKIKRVSSPATHQIHIPQIPVHFPIRNTDFKHIHIPYMTNTQPAVTFFRFTIQSHSTIFYATFTQVKVKLQNISGLRGRSLADRRPWG
jgi:hypothetical protein